MPIYRAAAHANLAALHWRAGRSRRRRPRRSGRWPCGAIFPIPSAGWPTGCCWPFTPGAANWPRPSAQAQAILHPSQRRQPGDLAAMLATAVRAWQSGDAEAARDRPASGHRPGAARGGVSVGRAILECDTNTRITPNRLSVIRVFVTPEAIRGWSRICGPFVDPGVVCSTH